MVETLLGSCLGVFYNISEKVLGKNFVIHSTPLLILTEFGIVGFLTFSVFFLRFNFWLYQSNCNSISLRCLKLVLIVFIVASLFHDLFYQRVFWLVLGVSLAQAQSHKGKRIL